LERDIYRLDPLASTLPNQNKYLKNFLAALKDKGLSMFDPMARDKLSALGNFTYSSADGRYRSILDKIFTSFSHGHCNKTLILSWSRHNGVKYSDHRPALTRINLSTLCDGWIEYSLQPLQRPRVKIDPAAVTDDQKQELKSNVTKWRSTLSPAVHSYLYPTHDPTLPPLPDVTDDLLCEMHSELFVVSGSVFKTGSTNTQSKVYKTKAAGTAQHILCWLKRYKVSLVNLLDLKRHRGHCLCKSQRRTARRVAAEFHSDPNIHSSLPELSPLLSLHVRDWTETSWHSHMQKVQELHGLWKHTLDSELLEAKKLSMQNRREQVFSTPINSKARRNYHLSHKYAQQPLPAVMRSPGDSSQLLTGQAVNETWGSSATATRPNTMPTISTEPGTPPWLQPDLWTTVKEKLQPLQNNLMAPITEAELREFLSHTGNSSPGNDMIQYDVLRFLLFNPDLENLHLSAMLLRFLNLILKIQHMPSSTKTALLTFIHKSGDPLEYAHYRGISLLSCPFKIITGTLNGRLQNMLHKHTGIDTNQGVN
jgi:hypothetical protein